MQDGADEELEEEEEEEEEEDEGRNDSTGSDAGADGKADEHFGGESASAKVKPPRLTQESALVPQTCLASRFDEGVLHFMLALYECRDNFAGHSVLRGDEHLQAPQCRPPSDLPAQCGQQVAAGVIQYLRYPGISSFCSGSRCAGLLPNL